MFELLDNQQKIKSLIKDIDVYKEKVSKSMMQIKQVQDSVTELKVKNEDQEINIKDIKKKITDTQIRVHDVQDRVYDILAKQDAKLRDQSAQIRDLQVRVKDIQNRVYDILWQQKTTNYQRDIMFWQLYKRDNESLLDAKLRFFHSLPKAEGTSRKSQLVMAKLLKKIHDACVANNLKYWMDFGTLLGAIRHGGFIPWDDDIDLGMIRSDVDKLVEVLNKDKEVFIRKIFGNNRANGVHRICQVRWADTDKGAYIAYIDIFLYDYAKKAIDSDWEYFMNLKKELVNDSKALDITTNLKGLERYNPKLQTSLKTFFDKYNEKIIKRMDIVEEASDYIVWGFDNLYYANYHDVHMFHSNDIFPLKELEFEGYKFYAPNHFFEYLNPMYGDILSLPSDMLSHKHVKYSDSQLTALNILYSKYVENKEG